MSKKKDKKLSKESVKSAQKSRVPKRRGRAYRVDENLNRQRTAPGSNVVRVPPTLPQIRALCRDLVHNNVYAKRAVSVRTNSMIGTGIRIHVSGKSDEYARAFADWANSTRCDYERRKSLFGIEEIIVRSENEAGEGLAIIRDEVDEFGDVWPSIQCIDPEMIDERVRVPHYEGAMVRFGVEYDMRGRMLGMHIRKAMQDDSASGGNANWNDESYFVEEEDLIHFFEPLYAGQMRGIPRGAQVLAIVDIHNGLIRAALTKAETEMCFGVAIKRIPNDSAIGDTFDPNTPDQGDDYMPLDYIAPGMIYYLKDGEELQTISPSSSASFEPYVRIGLEAIATGFGTTYSQTSGDLSRVNYSSEKSGRGIFWTGIDALRSVHFYPLLHKIERRFREVYILNMGSADFEDGSVYENDESLAQRMRDVNEMSVTIIPPARERIDPQKDILVEVTELQTGGMTWAQFILLRGKDPDEQFDALLRERKKFNDAGLNLNFGSIETTVNALANSIRNQDEEEAAEEAQKMIEDNATLFDRKSKES